MQIDILALDGTAAGSIELKDEIFGLEPREDLIARMVRYQLDKRRAGTHKAKGRAEIARTGKKMYKQKGTGNARHGSPGAPFRGGGRAFGPVVRSHAHDLPKKVRALALKHALSAKARDGGLIIFANAEIAEPKTKALLANFAKLGLANALIIDGAAPQANFCLAARNIPEIDVLPIQGLNVYDILRREKLVLTKAALAALEADSHEFEIFRRCAPLRSDRRAGHHRKATLASEENKVIFKVRRDATKPQIKAAIERLFDVKVEAVNTILRKGKRKTFKGTRGVQSDVKKGGRDPRRG